MKITIKRSDDSLMVVPDTQEMRGYLTLKWREMLKANGRTTFVSRADPMFSPATNSDGEAGLITYQGFWSDLAATFAGKGHDVTVIDARVDVIGLPNLQLALVGLRAWQKAWVLKALMSGNSGLLGAPTRAGKSFGISAICRAYPRARIVITAPGVDLCKQLFDHMTVMVPDREVRGVFTGSKGKKQSEAITVCSVDSLNRMDPDDTDILIIDEPHAVVSDSRLPKIVAFGRARKYGFGATLNGRFDKKDRLIVGAIGPIISNVTYKEAVAHGAISPLKVLLVKIPFSKDTVPGGRVDRAIVYKRLLTQSSRTAALVKRIVDEAIPANWQLMAFIQDEKQAEFYLEHSMPPEGTIAMAKRMKQSERNKMTEGIASGEILRVLASNIYVQGVTFPDLKVVINLAGGGANTTAIQKPGRVLQAFPGKNYGILIDFVFECRDAHMDNRTNPPYAGVVGECWARHRAYTEIGYDVMFVDKLEEMAEIMKGAYDV